jgi:hypothetical protein
MIPSRAKASAHREDGSAALVVVAILAIVLLYLGSTLQTLNQLNRTIKLVERRQLHRLETLGARTNSVAGPLPENAIWTASALSTNR